MPAQQKPKPSNNKARNDGRSNGKASKKGFRRGSQPVQLTELQKALLGGGAIRRIERPAPDKVKA